MGRRTIGKLAEAAGVNVETVRYYERRGLIDRPPSEGSFREYPERDVDRLRFIRRAKRLGFTLEEIRGLLALANGERGGHCEVKVLAAERAALVRTKIDELLRVEQSLKKLITACSGQGPVRGCPIIESLNGADDCAEV